MKINIPKYSRYLFVACLAVAVSCSKNETPFVEEKICDPELTIISVDDALLKLDEFLSNVEVKTAKDSKEIVYSSIIPYYSNTYITKSGDDVPEAYLVNFANNEGFAILGATSKVAPIIAVVEEGNTDWDKIMSPVTPKTETSFENKLERDLLGPGVPPDVLLSMCVKGALYGQGDSNAIVTKSDYTTEILPLLGSNYNFVQQLTYCHKNNNKFVQSGCCAVALSIVLTYLKPTRLIVDNELLSYNNLDTSDGTGIRYSFSSGDNIYVNLDDYFTNSSDIPTVLDDNLCLDLLSQIDPTALSNHQISSVSNNVGFKRTRYKIVSAVFYTLNNIISGWNATGTMPDALVDALEDLRFTNVEKVKENSLTHGQIDIITSMLSARKPVLMCGWSLFELSNSHYWVVDGIRKNNDETLIHCNWGWGATYNGWFASDCVRPSSPVSRGSAYGDNEWNNILVFRYDKPTSTPGTYFTAFYDQHRVTYNE